MSVKNPDQRGFAAVALDNPKNAVNVGGAIRAAYVYDANLVVVGGVRPNRFMRGLLTDPQKGHRHLPVVTSENVFDSVPYKATTVGVEMVDDAVPLPEFRHPQSAFYIFGAEDATLGERVLSRCAYVVRVPTRFSMNLAATVNVVLYDRYIARLRKDRYDQPSRFGGSQTASP